MERNKSFIWSQAGLIVLLVLGSILSLGLMIPVRPTVFTNKIEKDISDKNSITTEVETQKRVEKFRLAMLSTWQKQALEKGLAYNIPKRFRGVTINQAKVPSRKKLIALTFDDGPWDNYTREILDILKEHQVKATFFVLGQALKNKPDMGRRIVSDGHVIANHTWNHRYHYHNPKTAASEIDRSSELIYKTTGVKTTLFRPPGGILNSGLVAYAKKKNYTVVMWSADSNDYKRPSVGTLVNSVVRQSTPGGIILLHDGGGNRSRTVESLVPMIQILKEQGYTFATIPELLEAEEQERKLGKSRKKKSPQPQGKSKKTS
ncbi:MAG: polysaccharide deacetylase family protein [Richelia sp.]|nr:polysaccharide deacetylase family protein [Richelia sp.]